jgi:ABC-type dipeptide/oligopeptide/nickel transport system permease component
MAATLIIAVTTVIGNFLSDLGIAILDPRIRLTGKR